LPPLLIPPYRGNESKIEPLSLTPRWGFLFLGRRDILKAVKYLQNIKGVKDEEDSMSVYRIINVVRMFDKTLYSIG
jgi:hypothetical protein